MRSRQRCEPAQHAQRTGSEVMKQLFLAVGLQLAEALDLLLQHLGVADGVAAFAADAVGVGGGAHRDELRRAAPSAPACRACTSTWTASRSSGPDAGACTPARRSRGRRSDSRRPALRPRRDSDATSSASRSGACEIDVHVADHCSASVTVSSISGAWPRARRPELACATALRRRARQAPARRRIPCQHSARSVRGSGRRGTG